MYYMNKGLLPWGAQVHRLRLVDVTLREEVMLLHLIEGGKYLRAHNGQCYSFSSSGHWDRYRGLVNQSTLALISNFNKGV
jgi:hypothetical protein